MLTLIVIQACSTSAAQQVCRCNHINIATHMNIQYSDS